MFCNILETIGQFSNFTESISGLNWKENEAF